MNIQEEIDMKCELGRLYEIEDKYNELLYAVARKFPNETRHQTALRYIKDIEAKAEYILKQSEKMKTQLMPSEYVEPTFKSQEWYATPVIPEPKPR